MADSIFQEARVKLVLHYRLKKLMTNNGLIKEYYVTITEADQDFLRALNISPWDINQKDRENGWLTT